MVTRRPIRIDLGYDGRSFYGSQRQASVRTVQSELEAAIEQVTGRFERFAFAGRTDRGVHAVGQVASGKLHWSKDLERLRYALDSVTGNDLVVYRVSDADPGFHARHSARRREYRYRIYASKSAPVLLRGHVWWLRRTLDLDRLNAASRKLIGRRDFRSFAGDGIGSGHSTTVTERVIDLAEWRKIDLELEREGTLYEFRIRADGFLPHMVRNIASALGDVGSGVREHEWFEQLMEQRDRRYAPPPAPPDGLTLWSVEYKDKDDDFEREPGTTTGLDQE